MNELSALAKYKIEKIWQWRDKRGFFYCPYDMQTRHLFYTFRMIWNHSMPDEVRIKPYQHYVFSSFYTPEYMKEAIRFMGHELFKRTDIKPQWRNELDFMASHFIDRPVSIGELTL